MGRKKTSSLLAALALTALAAGCGGSSKTTSTQATSAAPTPTASSAPPLSSTSSTPSTTPNRAVAVEACKQAVAAQTTLTADQKTKLDSLCSKAGSGDEKALKKEASKICEEVVGKSVPEGAAREQADKGCQHA